MNGASQGFYGIVMLSLLFTGCGDPTSSARGLVPGLIFGFAAGDPQITFSVTETSVTIEVVTYGNTCREKGELRISSQESYEVSVSPFDWFSSDETCDDILLEFEHSATIDLEKGGTWNFMLFGQDSSHKPTKFEYHVDVGV